jgi:hypothetical protein
LKVTNCSIEQWLTFVNEDRSSTFFHHPEWYGIWADTKGFILSPKILKFSSGKKACLPLAYKFQNKGMSRSYVSSPGGTFGGVLCKEPLTVEEEQEYRAYLATLSGVLVDSPHREKRISVGDVDKFTQAVNLIDGDPENYKDWSKGHKSAAKRALREGVEISIAETQEDWDGYYRIYLASIERWGDNAGYTYPASFFKRVAKLERKYCKLWLAKYEGGVISGCLCFYHEQHTAYWHGAGDSDYFKLGAVHALQREIMVDAKAQGIKWYDFNPSNGHEGVMKFKKGFGTEIIPYLHYRNSSIISKVKGKLFKMFSK